MWPDFTADAQVKNKTGQDDSDYYRQLEFEEEQDSQFASYCCLSKLKGRYKKSSS